MARWGRLSPSLIRDEAGHVAQGSSTVPLVAAERQPLTAERLEEQLGRLGELRFAWGRCAIVWSRGLMIPVSELNRMRREVG